MKILQSSLFRAICAIVVGVMLIQNPDSTVTWLTVAIGVIFFLSGAISCVSYFVARRNAPQYDITDGDGNIVATSRPMFPIVGIGSLILGLLLALTPNVFVTGLMYVIGLMLVLGAIGQFMALAAARRVGLTTMLLWVCPSIVFLTGIYAMLKPMETASLPLLILGWCCLLYGVTEIINSVKIALRRKAYIRELKEQEAVAVEEEASAEEIKDGEEA